VAERATVEMRQDQNVDGSEADVGITADLQALVASEEPLPPAAEHLLALHRMDSLVSLL
jgi:hypothetical protein